MEIAPDTCIDDSLTEQWYATLLNEIDFHCSACEGLHLEIADLESKAKAAYESTARSMRGLYDPKEIANRWLAMLLLASTIHQFATVAKDAHQICGADLSGIQQYYDAALERYLFHCPQVANAVK